MPWDKEIISRQCWQLGRQICLGWGREYGY